MRQKKLPVRTLKPGWRMGCCVRCNNRTKLNNFTNLCLECDKEESGLSER